MAHRLYRAIVVGKHSGAARMSFYIEEVMLAVIDQLLNFGFSRCSMIPRERNDG